LSLFGLDARPQTGVTGDDGGAVTIIVIHHNSASA
jgi:hypothetical protein